MFDQKKFGCICLHWKYTQLHGKKKLTLLENEIIQFYNGDFFFFFCQGNATRLANPLENNVCKKPFRNLKNELDKSSESKSMHSPLVVIWSFWGRAKPHRQSHIIFVVDMGASEARRRVVCMHRLHINTVLINRQLFYLWAWVVFSSLFLFCEKSLITTKHAFSRDRNFKILLLYAVVKVVYVQLRDGWCTAC